MKDSDPYKREIKAVSPTTASVYCLERISRSWHRKKKNFCRSQKTPGTEETELTRVFRIHRTEYQKRQLYWLRTLDTCRWSVMEHSAEYWPTHACEKTTWVQGKKSPKRLGGKFPGTPIRPGILPISKSRLKNLKFSGHWVEYSERS